jgi:Carboxypeptidase regulatory-like domain
MLQPRSCLIPLAVVLTCVCLGLGQNSRSGPGTEQQVSPGSGTTADRAEGSDQRLVGRISGRVIDQSGAVVIGARVRLERREPTPNDQTTDRRAKHPAKEESGQDVLSGTDGQFAFTNVAPGPFELTVTSPGFAMQTSTGVLHPGEDDTVPPIGLDVAEAMTEVKVALTHSEMVEVADAEIKVEEKQRVLGAIPNFYVSYVPDAVPLDSKQKFKLALRTVVDPFTFVVVAGAAGVEQAQNHFSGYGQGAEGYAKRFGAGYADTVAGTFIGSAILPSLLKQDPRYFYKGTGSIPARFMYAIANAVICKGDNGRWQVNYSNILGSLAAGGISNLYYPSQDRDGAGLTVENGAIGIGSTAIGNLFQEFVVKKLTPKVANRNSNKP